MESAELDQESVTALPPRPTPLIGRQREVEEFKRLLLDPGLASLH